MSDPTTTGFQGVLDRTRSTVYTAVRFFMNKLAAILLLAVLLYAYQAIPDVKFDPETGQKISGGMPYSEVLYVLILVVGSTVVAPFIRLLVFPEAADYAEQGWLRRDLNQAQRTPALIHYWYATGISYLLTIACFASLSH